MASTQPPSQQPSDALDLEKKESEEDHSKSPSDEHELELKPGSKQTPKHDKPANQDQEPEWVSGFKLFTVMAAVTFVCFLMLLDSSIVSTAVPRITNDFHSLPDVGWYGSAYQLGRYVVRNFSTKQVNRLTELTCL